MDYLNKKTVRDIDVKGKRVFLRCDFNVPFDEKGNITDTKRIDESLKTIKYLIDNDAKLILCSHLGRPKNGFEDKLSLKPVAKYLKEVLGRDVKLAKDVAGEDTKRIVNSLKPGEICMLENIRFEDGERSNSPEFAKKLASLADVCINDAFGASHRAHASTAGVAKLLPAGYGFLIEKEISTMSRILNIRKDLLFQS